MNIIWKRPDGGISVTHLSENIINSGSTAASHAAELINAAQTSWEAEKLLNPAAPKPDILTWIKVAESINLPISREWRNAWAWTTEEPVIDICPIKAVEVTKERLRLERSQLLKDLDIQYLKAHENGDEVALSFIRTEKQRLRDITKQVDEVDTGNLDELKRISCF